MWTQDYEILLEKIRENSIILSKAHKKRYTFLKDSLKYFRIPLIFISGLNSIVSIGAQPFFDQQTISLSNCIMSLTCSIISSVEMYFGLQSQMENELTSSKEYYILSTTIFKILSLHRENRVISGKDFLESTYSQYIKLIESSCLVNRSILDKLTPLEYLISSATPSLESEI